MEAAHFILLQSDCRAQTVQFHLSFHSNYPLTEFEPCASTGSCVVHLFCKISSPESCSVHLERFALWITILINPKQDFCIPLLVCL